MKIVMVLAIASILCGCVSTGMDTQFSCGIGEGLGCKSVSEVNHIVDERIKHVDSEQPVYAMLKYHDDVEKEIPPQREPEQKLRIWFSPYVDEQDNDVGETIVYTVVKDARWKDK